MSGDVILADDQTGSISRLLDTAQQLFDSAAFHPAALVGGLAVTCRVQTVHRATTDVDTVTDGEAPVEHALEYLADGSEAKRIVVDGVKVDATRTTGLINRSTGSGAPAVEREDLVAAGRLLAMHFG